MINFALTDLNEKSRERSAKNKLFPKSIMHRFIFTLLLVCSIHNFHLEANHFSNML